MISRGVRSRFSSTMTRIAVGVDAEQVNPTTELRYDFPADHEKMETEQIGLQLNPTVDQFLVGKLATRTGSRALPESR